MDQDDFVTNPDAEYEEAIAAMLAREDYLAAVGLHAHPEDD